MILTNTASWWIWTNIINTIMSCFQLRIAWFDTDERWLNLSHCKTLIIIWYFTCTTWTDIRMQRVPGEIRFWYSLLCYKLDPNVDEALWTYFSSIQNWRQDFARVFRNTNFFPSQSSENEATYNNDTKTSQAM